MNRTLLLALALLAAAPAPVAAQAADPAIEAARAAGQVGEQDDGYLGLVSGPADLRARVDQINIKRRAAYTDLASQRGVTVTEVAAATACELLASRVPPGGAYRVGGEWRTRAGSAPVQRPAFCR